jgi:glycosyltransferase involved in cell wall biosynthesis
MKIGIEAQRIFRRKKHGMDIVALELIRNIQLHDKTNSYVVFTKDDEDREIISASSNVEIAVLPSAPYPYWEQVLLPRAVKNYGVDLLHCTSNTAPLNVSVPLVVTLHDIIYLEKWNFTQGTYYQILGNLYRRWNVPSVVRKAKKVLTVSQFEEKRIRDHFGLSKETIETVYNGVGNHFQKITEPAVLASARKKYNLPPNYIFFLGNTDPKKNVEGVLRSLSILRKRNVQIKLLTLDIDRKFLAALSEKIGDTGVLDMIVFTGYVPNEELPAIYSMAEMFIYPSLRESFGLPVLEAMACETPVITSDTSSMPEVAGDAALLVDPTDPESLVSAIARLLGDENLREALREKGLKRAGEFSWKSNAIKTVRIYEALLANGK